MLFAKVAFINKLISSFKKLNSQAPGGIAFWMKPFLSVVVVAK